MSPTLPALLLPTLVMLASASPALAYRAGLAGYSEVGCGECHPNGGGATLRLSGPEHVHPGAHATLSVVLTHATAKGGGLNMATTGGLLQTTDHRLRLHGYEVTHQGGPSALHAHKLEHHVLFMAPHESGWVKITAAGNAVNQDGCKSPTTACPRWGGRSALSPQPSALSLCTGAAR